MEKTSLFILVSMLVLGLMIPTAALSGPKYGGTLIYGVESDFQQFDPHKSKATIEGVCFRLMGETLVMADKNLVPQPSLAESWETSPDGLVWNFHLKKGVKFHNGRELTAEDIKWNFDRVTDPKLGSTIGVRLANVKSVEVVDKYTIRFILKEPSGSFLAAFYNPNSLSFQIIAPESVNKDGKVIHPIGTGPFKFAEWKSNDYTKFVRFDDYRVKGLPYLDAVIIKPVPDQVVRISAVKSGDLDVARWLPVEQVAKLMKKSQKGVKFSLQSGAATVIVWFNHSKPPFNDIRVRQAVALGIDKEQIEQAYSFGYGEVLNQPFSKNTPWNPGVPEIKRDVAKAKALLKEAGYPNGLDITIHAANAYPSFVVQATVMQQQLQEIGMNVKLDISDWPTAIKKYTSLDFTIASCGVAAYHDPEFLYRGYLVPKGPFHFFTGKAYNNPDFTQLINEAARERDQAKRLGIYKEAVALTLNDYPYIVTFSLAAGYGWQTHVKGYEPAVPSLVYSDGGLQYAWIDK